MKTIKPLSNLFSLFICVSLCCSFLYAQSQQGMYMNIDYIHIEPSDIQEFENRAPALSELFQRRIGADALSEWYLYRVRYKGAADELYNYIAISISTSPNKLQHITEALQKGDPAEFLKWLQSGHSELWKINNSVLPNGNSKPGKFLAMDYMRVQEGMEYAYQMMEDDIARPLHERRMELGNMTGWELFSLITPGGTNYNYNFATGNYYDNLGDIEFGFTEEIIRHTSPDTDMTEFFDNINNTRDLVRSEVWELVTFVK